MSSNEIIPNIPKHTIHTRPSIMSSYTYKPSLKIMNINNKNKSKKNINSKIELLRNWINDTFYTGKIKEFCNSKDMVCQGASRLLYRRLLNPINQTVLREIIGADVETLNIIGGVGHNYLTIKLGDKLIIIDPTFGQFVRSHNKIFVGTVENIKEIFDNPSSRISVFASIDIYEKTPGKLPPTIDYNFMNNVKKSLASGRRTYNNNNNN